MADKYYLLTVVNDQCVVKQAVIIGSIVDFMIVNKGWFLFASVQITADEYRRGLIELNGKSLEV